MQKSYPKISKFRVHAKRAWADPEQREQRIKGMTGRKYSKKGLASLRRHAEKHLNHPDVVARKNYRINHSLEAKRKPLPSLSPETVVIDVEPENDYCGVLEEVNA